MYKLLLSILIIFSFTFTQEDGEIVKNVTAAQRTDGSKILDIYNDLEEHEFYPSFYIYVMVEWPEVDHTFYLTSCGGDVWHNIFPGVIMSIKLIIKIFYNHMMTMRAYRHTTHHFIGIIWFISCFL